MKMGGTPKPKDPVHVPTPEDPAVVEARRLRMAEEQQNKKGRASTALSGGGDYSRTTLG